MKENAGFIALITVALAFVGVSGIPWKSSESPKATEQTAKGKIAGKTENPTEIHDACAEIRRRIEPFLRLPGRDGWQLPPACYADGKGPSGLRPATVGSDLQILVATAPNPVSTHLPLFFDRTIETIQSAARDAKFSYNSSWFPWDEASKEYLIYGDQRSAENALSLQMTQPGILTFRRAIDSNGDPYDTGLIVFVVAEQPTGGIDGPEFESALDWIDALGALNPQRKLQVLAPIFSGSLPSLKKSLDSPKLAKFIGQNNIAIYSGSVSGDGSVRWFSQFMDTKKLGSFHTAMDGDSRMVQLFCQYVMKEGYDLDRIALLSEDETAFGEDRVIEGVQKGPLHLSYPRDIATLRSAYQQQALLGPTKTQSGATNSSNSLRGDLSEPASSEHDTVRSYGGQLTPLAQESSLIAITDILKTKHIQFIILRSTNTLDQIFLSQFFRRAYPEGRIIIDGADLLFRRGGEGSSLRGVMLLSNYPLLTWQQDWTPTLAAPPNSWYSAFGEDVIEGEYIAARQLLPYSPALIANYSLPTWAQPATGRDTNQTPATWVSVIGHHQFWPVAVLDESTLRDSPTPLPPDAKVGKLPDKKPVLPNGEVSPLGIRGGLQLVLALGLAWSLLHLAWCSNGSVAPSTSAFRLAYFAPIERPQHAALIAMGSLLPALAAAITAFATGLMTWSLRIESNLVEALWVAIVVALAAWACKNNYALPIAAPKEDDKSKPETPDENKPSIKERAPDLLKPWRAKVLAVAIGFFLLFFLLYLYMTCFSPGVMVANRVPAYWRSANLLSGVSPLLPQILLLVGLYCWFWFTLRGLALFGADRPLLPKLGDLLRVSDLQPPDGAKKDSPAAQDAGGTGHDDSAQKATPNKKIPDQTKNADDLSLMPMFSRQNAGDPAEEQAIPWSSTHLKTLAFCIALALSIFALSLGGMSIRTLGERAFGVTMFFWLVLCMAMVLADSLQLWSTWKHLRALLVYLDRLPLRRTLASLKGLSWGSVVSVSGNTLGERYRVVSRQSESLRHLTNQMIAWDTKTQKTKVEQERTKAIIDQLKDCGEKGLEFAKWYVQLPGKDPHDLTQMRAFQERMAQTAGMVLKGILQREWHGEKESLIIRKAFVKGDGKDEGSSGGAAFDTTTVEPHVLAAEEFVVLPYIGFIQNVLGRIRTMIMGCLCLFVATTFAVASYPFDPLPQLGIAFLTVFVITAGIVTFVYAQMNRDTTLSHITNTSPGKLGSHFWVQLITFGVGPTLGLLTTLFPSITDFVSSWLQPSMQALK
jgi:hypothetical protein